MPVSRKNKRSLSRKKNKGALNTKNNSHAPKPVKMNYYEWSFDDKGKSLKEQLSLYRILGKEASEKFPEKYGEIKKWFEKYGQTKILSFALYYFMCRPAGYDEEAEKGSLEFPSYYLELLQAIALQEDLIYNAEPFSSEVYVFKKHLQEVGELNKHKFFNFPEEIDNQDALAAYLLRSQIIMDTTAVRNWSYEHLMKLVTTDLANFIKDDFIKVHQFCPSKLLSILYKMTEIVEDRINEHRQKTISFLKEKNSEKVFDAYEKAFPVINSSPEQRREMWQRFNRDLSRLKAMFLLHSDYFLEGLFTFSLEDIQSFCDGEIKSEEITRIFDLISLSFGDLKDEDEERFILGNPVLSRPFIKVEESRYFSSLWMIMTHVSLPLLEYLCSVDPKLVEKYNLKRGTYLEDSIFKLFKEAFPTANMYAGSKWIAEEKEYENDLLVVMDEFALVIEAKAGTLSAPAKRGARERLSKTLKQLVEEPSDQALRFIEYLKENPHQLSLKVKKGPNNTVDASKLKYFIPIGVTLSHLGGMTNNLKMLIKAGVTNKKIEELAPSISLTDLMVVFDLLPLTSDKVHYLQRRREIDHSIEYFGDELDLLAWYLDTGFNFNEQAKQNAFVLTLKSKELDHYIIGNAKGGAVAKPTLKRTKWWNDILLQIEDRKKDSWLRNCFILLNFPEELQKEFERDVEKIAKSMLRDQAEYPHNWIIYGSPDNERQFFIAGYCYRDSVHSDRNDMFNDIFQDEITLSGKGKLILAINVDKDHYPYSAIASWISEQVFDSNYMIFARTQL